MMATHAMQAAEYFAVGDWPPAMWRHYALSFDVYTHFTYVFFFFFNLSGVAFLCVYDEFYFSTALLLLLLRIVVGFFVVALLICLFN